MDLNNINHAMDRLDEEIESEEQYLFDMLASDEDLGVSPTDEGFFRFLMDRGEDAEHQFVPKPPGAPSADPAGSTERIAEYCRRVERGEELFAPGDSREVIQRSIPKDERSLRNFGYYFSKEDTECPHCLTKYERVIQTGLPGVEE